MRPARRTTALAVATGLLLLFAILVMPSTPAGLTPEHLLRLPLELPLVLLGLLLRPGPILRAVVVVAGLALLILRLADLGTALAFSRPFDPVLDLHLLVSGWSLLSSSIGLALALGVVGLALCGLALVAWLLWIGLRGLARLGPGARLSGAALAVAALVAGLALPTWSTRDVVPKLAERVAALRQTVADLRAFDAELAADPVDQPSFAALAGRDVVVAFVESYGRSFLEDARFRDTALSRLDAVEAELTAAGWHARSAWLAAPTRGGQSWLSHGTLLSGLWIDSQVRYDRLMASDRRSLNRLFRVAGWRTGAAMPAITLDWPEAEWFGYDRTLDAAGLAYAGRPFEWVTMPDQYTWSALDRMLRDRGAAAPVMIETALITSHAPWTPLPRIVDWDAVGDGAIFDGTRRDGDTPREVWSDRDRIRTQYARSLDYALQVTGQYIARDGRGALFVILGDHQPAPLLTGQGASPDVPVHVIADDPRLLDRLPATLFAAGMRPDPGRPTLPMQDMRALLSDVFETPLRPVDGGTDPTTRQGRTPG